jgi:hypothetical protein
MTEVRPQTELSFPDIAVELKRQRFIDDAFKLSAGTDAQAGFAAVDVPYQTDRLAYLGWLEHSTERWDSGGSPLDISLLYTGEEEHGQHLVVTLSPLNDGRPRSTARTIHQYVSEPGAVSKSQAAPNSWGPVSKLSVGYEFGKASGVGAAHLQVYAPEIQALSGHERRLLRAGDPRPYGRIVDDAIQLASQRRREITGEREGFSQVHLVAAGMCGKALGAAMFMLDTQPTNYELASVSLQNLSVGTKALEAAGAYMTRKTIEVPPVRIPENFLNIDEPAIRQQIDGPGAEFWGLQRRIIQGGFNHLFRLGRTEHTYRHMPRDIARLINEQVPLSITNPVDEGLNQHTLAALMDVASIDWTDIHGVYDEAKQRSTKVGQMVNEQASVMAITANRGISRSLSGDAYPSANN